MCASGEGKDDFEGADINIHNGNGSSWQGTPSPVVDCGRRGPFSSRPSFTDSAASPSGALDWGPQLPFPFGRPPRGPSASQSGAPYFRRCGIFASRQPLRAAAIARYGQEDIQMLQNVKNWTYSLDGPSFKDPYRLINPDAEKEWVRKYWDYEEFKWTRE
jgi:hypothetical protein